MTCSDGSASAFVTCSDNQLAIRSLSRLIANRAYRVRIGDLGVDCSSAGPEPSFVNHVCRYGAPLDGWLSSANSSRAAPPLGFSLPPRPAHPWMAVLASRPARRTDFHQSAGVRDLFRRLRSAFVTCSDSSWRFVRFPPRHQPRLSSQDRRFRGDVAASYAATR